MTNAEKFKEVFGYPPSPNARCVAPKEICDDFDSCRGCPFADWWNKEYKPCFVWKSGEEVNKQTQDLAAEFDKLRASYMNGCIHCLDVKLDSVTRKADGSFRLNAVVECVYDGHIEEYTCLMCDNCKYKGGRNETD